jgi:prolyl-tRNA synthetase
MRLSSVFGHTLHNAPAGSAFVGEQLLIRGGFIRPAGAEWTFLPLGQKVLQRLAAHTRTALEPLGGQEMAAGAEKPLWAIVAALAGQDIESYRDLPRVVYHFTWAGCEVCLMHASTDDWDASYSALLNAWESLFRECQVTVVLAEENAEGTLHRFIVPHPLGETRFVRCEGCGYVAHIDAAVFARERRLEEGKLQPLKRVPTPGTNTIAALCEFLAIHPEQTLKAVFYVTEQDELIFALIRGDLEISQTRLAHVVGAERLQPATEKAIASIGAAPGYASPIGLQVRSQVDEGEGVIVIVDRSVQAGQNFVTGANEVGYHVTGANYLRDFHATLEADIAEVYQGAHCARCGKRLHLARGITLGFAHRPRPFSEATYLDAQGKQRPVAIGAAAVNFDAVLLAVAEGHYNEYGICWPLALAPYAVHLVMLGKAHDTSEAAEALYQTFLEAGIPVLFDDRPDPSPGIKFSDADLIGLPLRATVGKRSLEAGGVEFKKRREPEMEIVPLDQAVTRTREILGI